MPNQPERCCNKLVNARIQKKKLKTLRNRLKAVRKSVDNSAPRSFGLPHLKRNLKKAKMLEDQYKNIEHQNRTLLQRMSNIMENPSRTTDNHLKSYGQWSRSLNLQQRRENLDRITFDNGYMLDRLQRMEPYYKVDNWERDYKRSEKIMRHMMEFEYRGGAPSPSAVPAATDGFVGGGGGGGGGSGGGHSKTKAKTKRKTPRRFKKGSRTHAKSPSRLKQLKKKDRQRTPVPIDDEVVEIFRFPSLAIRGLGAPDSAWDISLFDSRATDEEAPPDSTVLVLRGNKVTRTAVATLALDDKTLDKVISTNATLQEVFEEVRSGIRAYRALGLVRGDTQLTTQLANLLLGQLRVTADKKFKLVFEESDEVDSSGEASDVADAEGAEQERVPSVDDIADVGGSDSDAGDAAGTGGGATVSDEVDGGNADKGVAEEPLGGAEDDDAGRERSAGEDGEVVDSAVEGDAAGGGNVDANDNNAAGNDNDVPVEAAMSVSGEAGADSAAGGPDAQDTKGDNNNVVTAEEEEEEEEEEKEEEEPAAGGAPAAVEDASGASASAGTNDNDTSAAGVDTDADAGAHADVETGAMAGTDSANSTS